MDEDESGGGKSAVLLSVVNTSNLLGPIASSQRIKYTCVGISPYHVALGANTGGVYCFHRHDFSYIRILANQEGCISLVRFSPGGSHVAVVSGGGHVSLWELNLTGQGGISKRVHTCTLFKDSVVTDLVWDNKGARVFFGNDQGRVAVSYLPKKMFKKPDDVIYTEKAVVQMDMHQDQLLVSMVTRCIIINVASHEILQVGKKARDGAFGACFNYRWPGKPPVVYSARPGSRMWAADVAGTVVSTLLLRELVHVPPSPLFGPQLDSVAMPAQTFSVPHLHFPQLFVLHQHYMVGWAPGSALCFFQCATYKFAVWTRALEPEDKVSSDGSDVWVVCGGGREVKVLQLVPVREALRQLLQLQLHDQARVVIAMHYDEVVRLLPQDHTLLKDCAAALNAPDNVLNQQLVKLRETIATLLEEEQDEEQNEGGVDEEDQAGDAEVELKDEGDEVDGERGGGEGGGDVIVSEGGAGGGHDEGVDGERGGGEGGDDVIVSVGGAGGGYDEGVDGERGGGEGGDDVIVSVGGTGRGHDEGVDGERGGGEGGDDVIVSVGGAGGGHDEGVDGERGGGEGGDDVIVSVGGAGGGYDVMTDEMETAQEEDHKVLLQVEPQVGGLGDVHQGEGFGLEREEQTQTFPGTALNGGRDEEGDRVRQRISEGIGGVEKLLGTGGAVLLGESSALNEVIEEDPNFPCGPGVYHVSSTGAVEELDLDFVAGAEEDLSVSVAMDNETGLMCDKPRLPDHWPEGSIPEAREPHEVGVAPHVVGVARSQSKAIPLSACASSSSQPNSSTSLEASSSVGETGSVGGTPSLASSHGETPSKENSLFSLGPGSPSGGGESLVSSTESQGGVDREALAMRTRQMSLHMTTQEEDVIAVPTITRSSSSGSLTSKNKSKKKSRRKKSSTSQPHKDAQDSLPDSSPSLPVSKVSPTPPSSASLLYIVEEQEDDLLPFPDVGLPTTSSSPSVSVTPSPYTSLPSTPPLVHSPSPVAHLPLYPHLAELHREREGPVMEWRYSNKEYISKEDKAKPRSSSIDLSAIGGALSKGQKAVRGFFTSFSSQHISALPQMESVDISSGSVSSQPVVYRNLDADLPPFSPPSSAEEGELAEQLSPLAKGPSQFQPGGMYPQDRVPTPQPEVTAFTTTTMAARDSLDSPALLCSPAQLTNELQGWVQALDVFQTYIVNSDLLLATTLSPSMFSCACYLTSLCAEMEIYSPIQPVLASSSSTSQPCSTLDSFIQRYSDYLDTGRTLQLLSLKDWATRKTCWKLLATRATGEPSSPVNKDLAIALLLYPANQHNILHLVADKFPQIPPWQVALACDLWVNQSESTTDLRYDYVDYLCELLGNAVSDVALSMLSEAFGGDTELLIVSLRTVLQVEELDHAHHSMDAGTPRQWSHMIEWERADCLEWLVDMAVDMETGTEKQTAAETCREGGYWLGYVKLLVAMGDEATALKTLLALGDAKLLTQTQPWGFLLESVKDWELVLKFLAPPAAEESLSSLNVQDSLAVESPDPVLSTQSNSDTSHLLPHATDETRQDPDKDVSSASPSITTDLPQVDSNQQPSVNTMAKEAVDTNGGLLLKQLIPSLVGTLTPQDLSSLLTEHSSVLQRERWGEKEKDLHSLILTMASLHTQQRGIAHSVLEKLDRYLWTKRANTVGPHLRLVLQAERDAEHATKDKTPLSPTISTPVPVHPRLEDINANWGTRTSNRRDRCPMCGLGLTSLMSERQPGLVTFLCGHAVHRNCAPEGACVMCFKEHLPSHLFSPHNTIPTTPQQLADLLFKRHP